MPAFRELLYRDYSSSFGAAKDYDLALALRMFDAAGRVPACPSDAPIADLGCGKGEWLAWLRQRGFTNLRGFDFSAGELAHIRDLPVECGDVTTQLGAEKWRGHFALLHAKDIVEHLTKQEMVDFLLACHAALRPGGELWISTFNAQGIFAGETRYGDFTHESAFTPASMGQVLRACGFAVTRIAGIHDCPATLKGRVRRLIWKVASVPAELLLRARHGGSPLAGIDTFTVAPDLFAVATRPATARA